MEEKESESVASKQEEPLESVAQEEVEAVEKKFVFHNEPSFARLLQGATGAAIDRM